MNGLPACPEACAMGVGAGRGAATSTASTTRRPRRIPENPRTLGRERGGDAMAEHVYSVSEVVGSSSESIDDAIRGAIERASRTLRNLDWFEVSEVRGRIEQ